MTLGMMATLSALDEKGNFHCGCCGKFKKLSDLRTRTINTDRMHVDLAPVCLTCMAREDVKR